MTDAVTIDRRFMRQLGFFDPAEHPRAEVTFVGVGGIGSFAATAVAKLGIPKLTLIDPDIVEEHNAPNQFHALTNMGEPKVAALATEIASHIGTEAIPYQARIGEHGWETESGLTLPPNPQGVVVSGFDNMAARKRLWEQKIKLNPQVELYVDGRLDGQRILIYTVNPTNVTDIEKYEATLKDDSEIEAAACTERGLIDVGFQVGALICRQIRKHYNREDLDNIIHVNQNTLTIMKGPWL